MQNGNLGISEFERTTNSLVDKIGEGRQQQVCQNLSAAIDLYATSESPPLHNDMAPEQCPLVTIDVLSLERPVPFPLLIKAPFVNALLQLFQF